MANWILTAGLQNLRSQVNAYFPDRDHTSDGTIGDAAHQASTSSHNPDDTAGSKAAWDGDPDSTPEVRAWDMDSDLPGTTAQALVDHIRGLPGVSSVIRYMIYNRKMYHSRDGFAPTPYTGPSAHTEHVHFEGAWTQAGDNNTTYDFRLEEIPVALTAADKTWISQQLSKVDEGVWSQEVALPDGRTVTYDTIMRWLSAGESDTRKQILAAIAADDDTDETAIAQQVLAGLKGQQPEQTAAALKAVLGDQAAEVGRLLAGA